MADTDPTTFPTEENILAAATKAAQSKQDAITKGLARQASADAGTVLAQHYAADKAANEADQAAKQQDFDASLAQLATDRQALVDLLADPPGLIVP